MSFIIGSYRFNRALKVFAAIVVIVALGLLLNSSFISVNESSRVDMEHAKDFSFIKRFYCISDLFDKEQWHDNKGRSFDEDGVHLTNAKKHPVNACHYALFCFDEFKATHDSSYFNSFMDQVNYLLDATSYHEIDSDKIAYPYFITFHDLKPPWYSALAQSEAISVLIRYFSISGDDKVLPLLVKLKNFMVSSQEFGCGTMSLTPEGNQWYEEYPNSKQERQVLNGFFLSIVALHEYTHLFPGDSETILLYEAAIKTVKESFQFYNTGSWLKYNRGDGRQVSNGYMKWQVLELKLLHELTGDIYFKHLMMLVSSYCYNKPYETAGSKLQDYDFSVPLVVGKNDMLYLEGKRKQISVKSDNTIINTSFKCTAPEMAKTIDNNMNTFASFKYNDSLDKVVLHITFDMILKRAVGGLSISYAGLDSLTKPTISVFYKDSIYQKQIVKGVILSSESDEKVMNYKLSEIQCQSFTIVFENAKSFKEIKISNIALYEPAAVLESDFRHYLSPVYKSGEKPVSFDFETKGMKNVVVFHKSAKDEKALSTEKWDPMKVYTRTPVVISSPKNKMHRFLVICEPAKATATIGKVKYTD